MFQSKEFRKILFYAGFLVCVIIVLLAFQVHTIFKNTQNEAVHSRDIKPLVSIITSDSIHDQSWGSLAYEAYLKIKDDYPVQVELNSEMKTNTEMKSAVLQSINRGADVLIGHGREFSPVFTDLAPAYPDVHFVTIHGTAQYDNQSAFSLNSQSFGYFAGMMASLMTETNKVGTIVPHDTKSEGTIGFNKGVKAYNPDAKVYPLVVGSRDDEKIGAQLARELIDQGVDVIFSQGNAYNRAVIHEVEKAGIYAIGFLDDQAYMAKNHVLTSVLNDVPQAYVIIMEQFFSGEGIQPGHHVLGLSDGVYSLAPFGDMVPKYIQNKILQEIENVKLGKLEIGM